MTTVIFYEKPGCINNTRQKAVLQAAGHQVIARNLLLEPWSPERLRPFFQNRPVAEWFNPTAPAITRGPVNPQTLGAEAALALMVQDPLLIRRPLMEVGNQRRVGFDPAEVEHWIGLQSPPTNQATDLETCPKAAQVSP